MFRLLKYNKLNNLVKNMLIEQLSNEIKNCKKCPLCLKRKNVVIGDGSINSKILFIGEGPGEIEDIEGIPFVGPAGQLLTKMLYAIRLTREEVYIANIIKCRPPGNRDPNETEKEACIDYLKRQIEIIKPEILVCLGRISAQVIIDKDFKVTRQRGQWFYRDNMRIMGTYHPSALLRDPSKKVHAWEDFKNIKKEYLRLENA